MQNARECRNQPCCCSGLYKTTSQPTPTQLSPNQTNPTQQLPSHLILAISITIQETFQCIKGQRGKIRVVVMVVCDVVGK